MAEAAGRAGDPEQAQVRPRVVLLALCLTALAYSYQQTAIIPAIPTIQHAFHASAQWGAWLLSAYLMVATVTTPALGRLGDLKGAARVMLASLVVFLLGSLGAAVLPDLPTVLACRALQGVGGAVLPLSFSISRRHLPREAVGRAIGYITTTFGVGAVLGFATGGLIAQLVSWRLIFGLGALVVAASVVVVWRMVPRPRGSGAGTFDAAGALWLGTASLTLLLGLTLAPQLGWASPVPLALLAVAGLAGWAWVRTELRHDEPLVDLRVLRSRLIAFTNAATVGLGWARFATYLLIPELVRGVAARDHYGFAADPTVTGLFLLPSAVGLLLGAPVAAPLAARIRSRRVFSLGLLIVAAGAGLLTVSMTAQAGVAAAAFLLGVGSGLATQASSSVATESVRGDDSAVSASLNSTVRRLSGGVGSQVSVVILAALAAGSARSVAGLVTAFAVAGGLALVGAGLALASPDRTAAG